MLVAGLLATVAGCTDDEDKPGLRRPDPAPSFHQTPFPPARGRVLSGFHQELCPDLRVDSTGLAIRLLVPDSYGEWTWKRGNACFFQAGLARDFTISLDAQGTVQRYKERLVDPVEGEEGDAGTERIEYQDDVAVYGGRRGELLTWWSYNDGLPLDSTLMQADGVRLAWHTAEGRSGQWADELATMTNSIAVVRTRRDTCTADGVTVTYVVPRQAGSIDDYGDRCHLSLRPGSSLLRYAELDPDPRFSVDQLERRLPGRKHVESVRVERGAATLLGEPADRVTWVVVRPHRTMDGPRGTWRVVTVAGDDLQVSWGARPEEWRREQGDFEAFVRSLRVSPARPSRS
jgi:hypothetical protein